MNLKPTIQTYSGRYINFLDVSQNVYTLDDIAHSLAHLCRFTGHCKDFYSVAQHCVLVSYTVDTAFAFEGLMHDRIEAYMGDMSSPLKRLMPDFKNIEHILEQHSANQFQLPHPMSDEVKYADYRLLVTEKRDIMVDTPGADEWSFFDKFEPRTEKIVPWTPEVAKRAFKKRFLELVERHQESVGREVTY